MEPSAPPKGPFPLDELPVTLAFVAPLVVNLAARPIPDYDIYIGRTFAGCTDQRFGNPLRSADDTRPYEPG